MSSSSSSLSSSSPPPSQPTTPAITTTVTKAPLSSSSTDAPSPLPPASSILHLYAELLVHIRTVSLFASLRTSHTPATTAALSADGQRVTLTHEGHSASIRLPTRIEGGADAALMLPCGPPSKDLTLRLQVKEREGSEGGLLDVRGGGAGGRENVVPWGAGALEGCGRVACKGCGGEVVRVAGEGDGGVKRWMDLPNENWAEMMDFWHCHKPHEHHLPGHRHDERGEKGYAAGNRIVAKSEVGYVDLTYLLLKQEDCRNVQVRCPSRLQSFGLGTEILLLFLFLFPLASLMFVQAVMLIGGRQEGGPARARSIQWCGLRYNRPRLISNIRQTDCLPSLLLRAWKWLLSGRRGASSSSWVSNLAFCTFKDQGD